MKKKLIPIFLYRADIVYDYGIGGLPSRTLEEIFKYIEQKDEWIQKITIERVEDQQDYYFAVTERQRQIENLRKEMEGLNKASKLFEKKSGKA